MPRFTLVIALLSSLLLPAAAQEATPTPRIAVLGASVSAGFASGYDLAEVIEAALGEDARVVDAADNFFFMNPPQMGAKLARRAAEARPDLVVAIDFLFWYATGAKKLDRRRSDLEAAFELLDDLDCPIVLGTIPDMRRASAFMLPKRLRIPAGEISEVNAHILALAGKREKIRVLPLANWVEALIEGEEIQGYERIAEEMPSARRVFNVDGLHLTREGLIFSTALILDDLSRHELAGVELLTRADQLEARLAGAEFGTSIMVAKVEGTEKLPLRLRFRLPGLGALLRSGLGIGDTLKIRELRRYADPVELDHEKPVLEIRNLPAAVTRFDIQVRAEIGEAWISPWRKLNFQRSDANQEPLVLKLEARKSDLLRVKVLGGADADPIPGLMVSCVEELGWRRLRGPILEQKGAARDRSGANGIARLTGVGPDAETLEISLPDGKSMRVPIDRGSDPQIVRLPSKPIEDKK